MGKHASNRSWKPEDLEALRTLVAAGSSPARVSVHLKRSISSVQSKARLEGYPFPHRRDVKRERLAKETALREELGLTSVREM